MFHIIIYSERVIHSMERGMKRVMLLVVAVLASMVLTAPSGIAAQPRNRTLLTIPALGIFNKQILRTDTDAHEMLGPVWDNNFHARPGMSKTMVIDGHDVTPVPGYGAHGPFYNLYLIKPGYVAKIRWNGVWYTYRFVRTPEPHPQWKGNGYIERYSKKHPHIETIFFRCCWPRYTSDDWMTARAVLVKPHQH